MGQRPEEAPPCRTIEQGHEDIFIKTGMPGQSLMVEQARQPLLEGLRFHPAFQESSIIAAGETENL
jgi:hypothetical protein